MAFKEKEGPSPRGRPQQSWASIQGLHISQLDTELLAAEVVAIVHPKQSRHSLAKTHSNVRTHAVTLRPLVCSSQSVSVRTAGVLAAWPPTSATSMPLFSSWIFIFFCWSVYELRYEDSVARDQFMMICTIFEAVGLDRYVGLWFKSKANNMYILRWSVPPLCPSVRPFGGLSETTTSARNHHGG